MNLVCADTGGIPPLFAPGDGNQKEARGTWRKRASGGGWRGRRGRLRRPWGGSFPRGSPARRTPGGPWKGEAPLSVGYRSLTRLEVDEGKLERARRGLGRFLLATDVPDREALPAGEVLGRYKDQGRTVERGFRFLKDPLFFTSSAFPKRPERVIALALLVYAMGEWALRRGLAETRSSLSDQLE